MLLYKCIRLLIIFQRLARDTQLFVGQLLAEITLRHAGDKQNMYRPAGFFAGKKVLSVCFTHVPELAEKIEPTLEKYRSKSLPAIILIPGVKNNTGKAMRDLHKAVEKAVGSDILTN